MKWESCYTDDIERANIAKFSKLDDAMAPVKLLELFFDDVLVDMIVGYTKLHIHREKTNTSFEITNEDICLFLSILLHSVWYKLPDRKIYRETNPDSLV